MIPNELAGAIIGKGGETLKKLRDENKLSSINVSPKDRSGQDKERIVTIEGNILITIPDFFPLLKYK